MFPPGGAYHPSMSRWSDVVDGELEDLYAQVPDVDCKGLCVDACGPVGMGERERQRIKQTGAKLPTPEEGLRLLWESRGEWRCPALTAEGRCGVYSVRPMVCRVWGASEDLPCPYGCRPASGGRLLSPAKTYALMDSATHAGTTMLRVPEEHFQAAMETPEGRRFRQENIRKPVRNRTVSRKRRGKT